MAALTMVMATLLLVALSDTAQVPDKIESTKHPDPVDHVDVKCLQDNMLLTISLKKIASYETDNGLQESTEIFSGIIYPSGLGKNSTCMKEFVGATGDLIYSLPLEGCNTMSVDYDDQTVQFFNSIVVQPHLRLVTGGGKSYDVKCKYSRKELTGSHLQSGGKVKAARRVQGGDYDDVNDDLDDSLPAVTMRIYKGDPREKKVASSVKIGDVLTLVVSLDKQDKYNLLVSECTVKDGLGWAEQTLINDNGCPLDGEIMGMFTYTDERRKAQVTFPAHKFPYTSSVYYTCSVKLCTVDGKQCQESCTDKPVRVKRQQDLSDGTPATVEVFQGLYVNEANELVGNEDEVTRVKDEDEICFSQRNFAIGICIAGVILMILVIIAIAVILARRRRPKTSSRTGSSLYSGPYTNTGYSHTS